MDMAKTLGRICVTGATGKAGVATVRHLREHGYQVVATDIAVASEDLAAGVLRADLTDYGQATEVLRGIDARRPPGEHPGPGHRHPRGDVQRQHHDELQHLPRRRRPRPEQGGVGVKRDDAGPAVRPRPGAGTRRARRTPLRPGRRGTFPVPCDQLCPVEGRQRDHRGAGIPLVRHPVRGPAHLQHHGAPRLRALPRLLAGPALPQVEPVGLRRRPRRGRALAASAWKRTSRAAATSSSPPRTRS